MEMSIHEKNGVPILEPKGKIMGGPDATMLHEKLHDLIEQGKSKVIIDLTEVEWMNSTGLGILISGLTSLKNSGGELKLTNVNEKIQDLFKITKLTGVFDSFDSVDDALQAL